MAKVHQALLNLLHWSLRPILRSLYRGIGGTAGWWGALEYYDGHENLCFEIWTHCSVWVVGDCLFEISGLVACRFSFFLQVFESEYDFIVLNFKNTSGLCSDESCMWCPDRNSSAVRTMYRWWFGDSEVLISLWQLLYDVYRSLIAKDRGHFSLDTDACGFLSVLGSVCREVGFWQKYVWNKTKTVCLQFVNCPKIHMVVQCMQMM